jgi:hypothetical protein
MSHHPPRLLHRASLATARHFAASSEASSRYAGHAERLKDMERRAAEKLELNPGKREDER